MPPVTQLSASSEMDWTVAELDSAPVPSISFVVRRDHHNFPWFALRYVNGDDNNVTVSFHSHDVRVDGHGLTALIEALGTHRVTRVIQALRTDKFTRQNGPIVDTITVTERE